jgi:hypothetical protein
MMVIMMMVMVVMMMMCMMMIIFIYDPLISNLTNPIIIQMILSNKNKNKKIGILATPPSNSRNIVRKSFLKEDNSEVYVWGFSAYGHLGESKSYDAPHVVEELSGKSIVSLSCGEMFMVAVSRSGEVYIWGTLYNSGTSNSL